MKIASWNVNSLPVRLPQVLEWLVAHSPDILCLQETKVPDDRFPIDPLRDSGYHILFRGQPTYNGVAILSRVPPLAPLRTLSGSGDTECRFLSARFGPVQVVNCYVPNGQDLGTEKFAPSSPQGRKRPDPPA